MADLNRLAILINQNESDIYSLADKLGIDSSIIENAIIGGESSLTRNERLELEETMSRFERLELDEYGQAELQDLTDILNEIETYIDDFRNGDTLRGLLAENRIELSELERLELLFGQGNSTLSIQNTLIDWLEENEHKAQTFLDLFELDGFRIDGIKDSAFWAWFRETFYND